EREHDRRLEERPAPLPADPGDLRPRERDAPAGRLWGRLARDDARGIEPAATAPVSGSDGKTQPFHSEVADDRAPLPSARLRARRAGPQAGPKDGRGPPEGA